MSFYIRNLTNLCHKITMHVILYIIMKFKKYILCHELYTIIVKIFQYLMKFIYTYLMFHDIMKFKK